MVKGISRQVIVVHAPEPKLFEQAIFILKDGHPAVSDEMLMKEANQIMGATSGKRKLWRYGPAWACAGALLTGIVWLLTALL